VRAHAAHAAVLRAAFSKKLAAGSYKVSWHALADDGHHQEGNWTFTVR
jgi:methionine-rich copper-binding protein CopC